MKLIIDIDDKKYKWIKEDTLCYTDEISEAIRQGTPLEDIKAEPYFWEKCPYYEPDMMFDGEDEYDCGMCKYKDKSVLENIKAEIKLNASFSFRTLGESEGLKIALEIIDKHIKENKQ